MKNISINTLFELMRKIFSNLQEDPSLQAKMTRWGFPPDRIQEGHALLVKAQEQHAQKDDQYHDWADLSEQVLKDREAALQMFVEHVQAARLAFKKNPVVLKRLKISRINRSNVWAWTAQAHRFYSIVTGHAPVMKKRGVLPEELQQAKAGVEALLALKDRSARIKGNAENATEARNRTLDALRAWHVEFRAAARLALKDTPQRLEAFGIKTPAQVG